MGPELVTADQPKESRKSLPKKTRFEVLKRDSFTCQYCGSSAPEVVLEIDHIKPVAGGGTDDPWNLITSCKPCNGGKSARELSDSTVLAKSKRQLDELQSRREQLEMMMEWRHGLCDIAEDALAHICSLCVKYMNGEFGPSPETRHRLSQLLTRHGFECLSEAITKAAAQYLKVDAGGHITTDSARIFLDKIGAIATVISRTANDPEAAELYRIRGLLSHKLDGRHYDHRQSLRILQHCFKSGIPIPQLWSAVGECVSWSHFVSVTNALLEGYANA